MADVTHPARVVHPDAAAPPHESYGKLFLRFLRFGFLACGGPVAQIAMLRQELVEEEHWISKDRFNRTLAVYQVLPGPEAHELCVYFGMLARGRLGGFLAGLGFMLPGFVLMFALSWFYVTFGINSPLFAALFTGVQAAVVALIVRAVHRIGTHALHNRALAGIAAVAFVAQLVGVHFAVTLSAAGLAAYCVARRWHFGALVLCAGVLVLAALLALGVIGTSAGAASATDTNTATARASVLTLLVSGLRGGLLTFGGAYTVIPFLQNDAVSVGQWMSNAQFLDGIALGGILPAPLIIFATFVGYLGGGPLGALAMTFGIFLPAFAFTLVGHDYVERLIEQKALQSVLDGVTAGVVGLIAATTIELFRTAITSIPAFLIFAVALLVLFRWKSKLATPVIVLAAAVVGVLLF
ncbi:MAG: chromate efflux transporter [Chloroflexota bacterium]|nr:chromate efflux transporter [Chloroflexota bacterium]